MRVRAKVMLSAVLASFIALIATSLWFFSNPAGLTREEATSHLVTFAAQTLTLSAVTGFAAMATLEMLKRLFHLRGQFFRRRIPSFVLEKPGGPEKWEYGRNRDDFYRGRVRRLDIPLEQLIAQISYVTDGAVDRVVDVSVPPSRGRPVRSEGPTDSDLGVLNWLLGPELSRVSSDPTRLRVAIQAALDDLQVTLGNTWRARLRLASCVLAALFALAALIYVPVPPGAKLAALVGSFLIGGFLAGFFRDLVALVERFRRL